MRTLYFHFLAKFLPINEAADVLPAASILSIEVDSPDVSNIPESQAPMKNQGKKILEDVETIKKQLFQAVSMLTL